MDLIYRPSRLPEARIEQLQTVSGEDRPFASAVLSGRVKFMECVHDGQVIGHCIGNSATGEIIGLSVDDGYRRTGIARKLLSLVVALMRADGAQRIWLSAPADLTQPAHHFYGALGWLPSADKADGPWVILELPGI